MRIKSTESNAEERETWHHFLKRTKFDKEQLEAVSLQDFEFKFWRYLCN